MGYPTEYEDDIDFEFIVIGDTVKLFIPGLCDPLFEFHNPGICVYRLSDIWAD